MIRRGYSNVLMMEDDCLLNPNSNWRGYNSQYQTILRDLPTDYDIVFLGGKNVRYLNGTRHGKYLTEETGQRAMELTLVSNKGARMLLNSLPIVAPLDFQIVLPKWGRLPYYLQGTNLKILHSYPLMSTHEHLDGGHTHIKNESEIKFV